eukprot:CAMPEP_0182419784 /NCGR_PEP_ID=MMETSP1167-20130531/4151_1 /TAXON_ID=2988 /ORGANISM="Mallomonas Sp, Strain CCMP3275" /LENGTH=265 /DNA_ID=CAMNT_0024594875 /DNA_START=328 /DNA_END=1122 /DNA_ORIENTATION=-
MATFSFGGMAGALGAFVGMGGSFMAVPFLAGPLGLTQHMAHGTSIVVALTTGIAGCVSYASSSHIIPIPKKTLGNLKDEESDDSFNIFKGLGNVDIVAGICISSTASLTAILGALLSKRIERVILLRSYGTLLLCIAPMIPVRDALRDLSKHKTHDAESFWTGDEALFTSVKLLSIGLMTGLLSGIFGVGGGAIAVPALCFVTDMPYHTVLGTSLAAMIPTTFSSAATHFLQGTMLIRVAIPLALGSAAGAFMGGMVAKDVSDVW